VLVTRNRRELLARCLAALAAQTRPADEVLVVDNGSTDGTADLLAASTTPKGLIVLAGPPDGSVAHARNLAVARASGDVIAFTDDDCRPQPTWLEALTAGLREGVGIVQGRTTADPEQELLPLSRTQWTPCEWGGYETCNIAYDRSVLPGNGNPAAGPFDLDFAGEVAAALGPLFARYPFGEDTEMAWRIKRSGAVSRFAGCAIVEHHVFPPDPRLQLRRAFLTAGFPLLVRRAPELRSAMLWHRYLLTPQRARIAGAVSGTAFAAVARDGRPLVLAVPYAVQLLRTLAPLRPHGRRARLRALPILIARDLVETAALAYGSARARRVVL
jgi:glycosyltransferase involved in cell wall biosynthesis